MSLTKQHLIRSDHNLFYVIGWVKVPIVEEVVLLFFLKRERRQLSNYFNWPSNKLTLECSTLKILTLEHSSVRGSRPYNPPLGIQTSWHLPPTWRLIEHLHHFSFKGWKASNPSRFFILGIAHRFSDQILPGTAKMKEIIHVLLIGGKPWLVTREVLDALVKKHFSCLA